MNKAILLTALSIIFMSIGPTINKFALTSVSPYSLVFYNSLLCSIFSLPFIVKSIQKVTLKEFKYLLLAGILNGVSMYFLFLGLSQSSPALVSMLNRSYIVFSILIGAFILKEQIENLDMSLIVFAIFGIILFMMKKEMAQVEVGAFWGLFSGILFALCNFTIKHKLNQTSEYITLFSVNLISAIIFFFVCLNKGESYLALPSDNQTLSFIFLGAFLGSFLGLLFFYASIKTIPFYKANLYRSISPVVSLLFGLLFFPVKLTIINIIGLIILLSAFFIHSLIKVSKMKKENSDLQFFETDIIPAEYKSVLVFIKEGNTWMMVKNKFRSWEFPGGHKENNETVFETAKREAFEESGVEIKDPKYIGYYRLSSGHTTLVVMASVHKIHDIPVEFETEDRKFVEQLPEELSFNDAIYGWVINRCLSLA